MAPLPEKEIFLPIPKRAVFSRPRKSSKLWHVDAKQRPSLASQARHPKTSVITIMSASPTE